MKCQVPMIYRSMRINEFAILKSIEDFDIDDTV